MLQAMVPEPEDNPLFGGNDGDETFRNMMVEEYAKTISASGGIGIASHIQRELLGKVQTDAGPRSYDIPMGKPIEAYQKTLSEVETLEKQAASEGTDKAKQLGEAL